ncbi:MAG: hypothetical protein JO060_00140 [Candidatus Eremiobacteraeota bacterium]|nr:hypothetical protein [Candidatus Eremiobacteraeota bacterium]
MNFATWPNAGAYRAAVDQPDALGDRELEPRNVERAPGGLPRMYSGTFTTTFRFATGRGGLALRCFTHGSGNIEQRYSALSELVRYIHNDALCRTRYLARGIRVDGMWWPAVVMDWVTGQPLNEAVADRLRDPDAVLALARQFRDMVRSLQVLGLAHGDLQHANILVTDDKLRLIDYDAMFVPALAGLPQTEYGHRNYQHPSRRMAPFDSRLDRFSSIVIYTALVALATNPSLWQRFNDGENLLFRAHDFTSNGSSELFRTLLTNNATSALATALLAASNGPVQQVPSLEQVIEGTAGTMPATQAIPVPPPRHHVPVSRPRRGITGVAMLATLLLGLGIVAGFALATRPNHVVRRSSAVTHRVKPLTSVPIIAARPVATPSPRPTPSPAPTPSPSPLASPTPAPSASATPRPSVTQHLSDSAALEGSWRIDEANVQAGPMVWVASAALSGPGTIVLQAHKQSISGRTASPCERQTNLHAAVVVGAQPQTVPYDEVNCVGSAMSGEVHVDSFAPDGKSFSGSFWRDGTKLGDFEARKI